MNILMISSRLHTYPHYRVLEVMIQSLENFRSGRALYHFFESQCLLYVDWLVRF